MINYKKTYKESTSWRHWRLSCFIPVLCLYVKCFEHNYFD